MLRKFVLAATLLAPLAATAQELPTAPYLPLGLANGKIGHHSLDIDHELPPVERSQRPPLAQTDRRAPFL